MDINDILSSSCPKCGVVGDYDSTFDFYQCPVCSETWSDGRNDPDYDDDTPQALEAIAEMNMERIKQWTPNP